MKQTGWIVFAAVVMLMGVLVYLRPEPPKSDPTPRGWENACGGWEALAMMKALRRLREIQPATVQFEVHLNGEPAPGLRLIAESEDVHLDIVEGNVGVDGRVALELLPSTWSLFVELGGNFCYPGEWEYAVPISIEALPGAKVEAVVDVPLYQGHLTVLDMESGLPVKRANVVCRGKRRGAVDRTTDDDGRIALKLPPGTYALHRAERGARASEPVEVEWTSLGPVPDTVRLAEPESIDE